MGFPSGGSGKEPACLSRRHKRCGLIPGSGRSPEGGGLVNLLQYSCLENPVDRGAWRATVHVVAKSRTRLKWLSTHAHIVINIFSVDFLSFQVNNYITWVYSCSAYNIDRHLISMQWALLLFILVIRMIKLSMMK